MSLKNICFEHIKDSKVNGKDHSFYYGQFGEFKLVVDKITGFFNATKLCKQGNKNYSDWYKLKRTKDLIEYIKNRPEDLQGGFLYEILQGNKSETSKEISGTYVAKELILDIASWISPEFYLKCNDIIIKHFEYEYQKTINNQKSEIRELIEKFDKVQIKHAEERKQDQEKINELLELNHEMNDKLDIAVEERAPFPEESLKVERFIIIKRKQYDQYPYYAIRAQEANAKTALAKQKNYEILLDFKTHPNSKTLFTRIKLKLRKQGVVFTRNEIRIKEDATISEVEMLKCIKQIEDEKSEF